MQLLAVTPDAIDARSQSMFGIAALAKELTSQGGSLEDLFAGSGVDPRQLEKSSARMSRRQRLTIFRNARRLASTPDIALLAGSNQRLSDYGVYGYAFASCANVADAIIFSHRHLRLACPVLQIRYEDRLEGVVLSSHGAADLGDLLPFVAEYWRSSMTTLISRSIEQPFRSRRMLFPYAKPSYWRAYERTFQCPVEFGASSMEWHIDRATLTQAFPNANPVAADMFEGLCSQMIEADDSEVGIIGRIRRACAASPTAPPARDMAKELGMSMRSMFRRLAQEGFAYQAIVDEGRRERALQRLRDRAVPIKSVAQELGFSEATNFCKAFKRWTGMSPGEYRDIHAVG